MGRRAVVTGATGFIGWHVAERLRNSGWDVRGTVRPERPRPLPEGVEPIAVSLTGSSLSAAFRRADVIIHLAGLTQAARTRHLREVNVNATASVAHAASELGAHLVHVSSQAAAGPATSQAPSREEDPPNPITPYGVSKLAGELAVRNTRDLQWTILRPASVYGPRDRGFITLFKLAQRGIFLTTGAPSTAYTLVHVDDVSRAIEMSTATQALCQEVLFVGHSQHRSEQDMWQVLARVFRRRYRPVAIPGLVLQGWALAGDLAGLVGVSAKMNRSRLRELGAGGFVCSVDKAAAMLGFNAEIGLDTGFERTATWYRDQGWLK